MDGHETSLMRQIAAKVKEGLEHSERVDEVMEAAYASEECVRPPIRPARPRRECKPRLKSSTKRAKRLSKGF